MFWCSRWFRRPRRCSRRRLRPGGCSPSSGGWQGRWRPSLSPGSESSCPPCWHREAARTRCSPSLQVVITTDFLFVKGSLWSETPYLFRIPGRQDIQISTSASGQTDRPLFCRKTGQTFLPWPPTYSTSRSDKPDSLCFFTFLISWLSNVDTEHL